MGYPGMAPYQYPPQGGPAPGQPMGMPQRPLTPPGAPGPVPPAQRITGPADEAARRAMVATIWSMAACGVWFAIGWFLGFGPLSNPQDLEGLSDIEKQEAIAGYTVAAGIFGTFAMAAVVMALLSHVLVHKAIVNDKFNGLGGRAFFIGLVGIVFTLGGTGLLIASRSLIESDPRYKKTLPPPVPICETCGKPVVFNPSEGGWWCQECKTFLTRGAKPQEKVKSIDELLAQGRSMGRTPGSAQAQPGAYGAAPYNPTASNPNPAAGPPGPAYPPAAPAYAPPGPAPGAPVAGQYGPPGYRPPPPGMPPATGGPPAGWAPAPQRPMPPPVAPLTPMSPPGPGPMPPMGTPMAPGRPGPPMGPPPGPGAPPPMGGPMAPGQPGPGMAPQGPPGAPPGQPPRGAMAPPGVPPRQIMCRGCNRGFSYYPTDPSLRSTPCPWCGTVMPL